MYFTDNALSIADGSFCISDWAECLAISCITFAIYLPKSSIFLQFSDFLSKKIVLDAVKAFREKGKNNFKYNIIVYFSYVMLALVNSSFLMNAKLFMLLLFAFHLFFFQSSFYLAVQFVGYGLL